MKENSAQDTFAWQEGFGIFSVSFSAVEDVTKYINRQREHHAKSDFKHELTSFLEKHNITYDAEKIWWT